MSSTQKKICIVRFFPDGKDYYYLIPEYFSNFVNIGDYAVVYASGTYKTLEILNVIQLNEEQLSKNIKYKNIVGFVCKKLLDEE